MTTVLAFDRRPVAESAGERKIMALACGAALALAFVTLLVERVWAAETEHSRSGGTLTAMLRVLLLVTLAGATGAALNAWQGIDARTLALISALLPGAIALELMVRAVSTWFTPPERHAAPPERVHGTIARMLTSPLASSGEVGEGLRRRYGIDMRQSWVIRSTLRLLPVACAGLAFVAWLLSGVSVLQPDQRAVYERFGAPAAVWQPGLHVGMPWPFGRARMLENGAVHQLVVSSAGGDGGVAPLVAADARTPAQMDRLWDVAHPWETTQVIAGGSGQRQNFEIVNADVRLDYRIRQDDAAARASQYRFSETPALIRAIAGSEVVGYLASHRLDALVETRQTIIADAIRRAVQQQFDVLGGGIEIVAVVIESVHPPAGASAAWHNVQAAQIRAAASVAQARGLAATVVGSAAETAAASLDAASAGAAETVSAARTRQTTFAADIAARQAGGRAFPLEYYLHALQRGLQNANLTVIDDRLVGGNRATIDLRAYNTGDAAGAKRLY
ncbi:SPFH domain-containing protein [Caballeronia sp. LZ065]|uniref:SPFH domain-containing protein n=1 Tax=Caballeronia sp. LZ065 TaxID=3038571 RepID=UPI002862F5C1|nr:SPFH domain-containing protein [Caballeronia sp. LZ065]MDR5781379.1 SPFH domain-containing protein [Caballeronia sp. LZ065]